MNPCYPQKVSHGITLNFRVSLKDPEMSWSVEFLKLHFYSIGWSIKALATQLLNTMYQILDVTLAWEGGGKGGHVALSRKLPSMYYISIFSPVLQLFWIYLDAFDNFKLSPKLWIYLLPSNVISRSI